MRFVHGLHLSSICYVVNDNHSHLDVKYKSATTLNCRRYYSPTILGFCTAPKLEEIYASETRGFTAEIEAEMQKLEGCNLMLWQFPLWWFGLPAALKGWVDRVFAMGRIYGGGKIYETGVFKGKKALLSLTTGGPPEAYRQDGFNGDIHSILRPIHRGMLQFVGFDVLEPHIVYGPVRMTDEQRRQELEAFATRLRRIETESPVTVGRY